MSAKKHALLPSIIDLMEKANKDKYWIVEQIEKSQLNIKASPAFTSVEILQACPVDFLKNIFATLRKIVSESRVPRYSNTFHWFFTDIVAGANPNLATENQTDKIIALNNLIRNTLVFKTRDTDATIILPTGDGVAIGFKDSPEKPLLLALQLHKEIIQFNLHKDSKHRLDVRIGLDTGPVYPIIDLNNNSNVWGPGIIYARRIMDLGGAKHILTSTRFANDVQKLRPDYKRLMHILPGTYPIKHEELISISNIYGNIDGVEIGTRRDPPTKKIEKGATELEMRETANTFVFDYIEVTLNIVEPKTMLTHHTWLWKPVNQRQEPVERVFYYIDGDVPKNFPDLNVKVTDEEGRELHLQSLSVNKPEHKEFYVQLTRPFKPKQRGRVVKLEYDWEEPDRHYVYSFASVCKEFVFRMIAPRDLSISHKVVRILREIGEKEHASTPATVRYLRNKTVIEWVAHDLQPFDSYRFDW